MRSMTPPTTWIRETSRWNCWFHATNPRPVPKNVLHVINFFQQNGFGKQVTPGPDFKGELTNIDLTAETGLSHTTIDKSPKRSNLALRPNGNTARGVW